MTRTRLARLLVVLSAAALAAGCAAIPESTPVVVVDENLGASDGFTVGAPQPGLDPLSVVRLFVEAGVSHADEHQAARSYLTEESARRWDDEAPILVIDDTFGTSPVDAGGADDRRLVTLRTSKIGQLDQSGVFRLHREPSDFRLTLVKENGEWRITDPPRGLLMRIRDFRATFRVVDLSFVDATSNVLIKDRRWVLNRPASALPGRVVNLLLGEPSADLRGSVVNELSGARLLTNVTQAPDSVLAVDLTGLQQLTDVQRELAAAQIVRSIGDVVNQPVRILIDGERLTPDRPIWRVDDAQKYVPTIDVTPGLPGLVVTNGRVLQIGSNQPAVGVDIANAVSAAQSVDGHKYAVVAAEPSGAPRLWVGPSGDLRPVDLPATSIDRPNWRRARDEVWVVLDGNRLVSVTASTGAVQAVDVSELTRMGPLSELRLSRDGVRVAAIVGNMLVLGSIVGSGAQMSVRNTRVLPPPSPSPLVDIDFVGTDVVVVATASLDRPLYETSVDGLTTSSFGTANLTLPITSLAAVSGRPVLVADQLGVWSSTTASSVWQREGEFGPNSVPVYPG